MSLEFSDSLSVQQNLTDESPQIVTKQDNESTFIEENSEMLSMVEEDQLPSLEWDEEVMNDFIVESEESVFNKKSSVTLYTPDR